MAFKAQNPPRKSKSTMSEATTPTTAVLATIRAIQARKRAAGIVPDHVLVSQDQLYSEIFQGRLLVEAEKMADEFRTALDELQGSGTIHIGETMHDTYVREIIPSSTETPTTI
jgi:hypothetical protein